MSLSVLATPALMPRRIGRPPVADDPAERARHIECAALFFGADHRKWPVKRIARSMDISPATVYLWVRRAIGYHEPEAQAVRNLARKSRRKIGPGADLN